MITFSLLLLMKADCEVSVKMVSTPLGLLELRATNEVLLSCRFLDDDHSVKAQGSSPIIDAATQQLQDYFSGQGRQFDLPLHFEGTAFRLRCWSALCDLSYGETVSYGKLGQRVGGSRFARAVGQAIHHNPFAIIVPCHRVLRSGGQIGGYAGGLDRKRWLLQHEAK